jgi:hypothetical protein
MSEVLYRIARPAHYAQGERQPVGVRAGNERDVLDLLQHHICNGLSPESHDQAASLVSSFPTVPHLASATRGPCANTNIIR